MEKEIEQIESNVLETAIKELSKDGGFTEKNFTERAITTFNYVKGAYNALSKLRSNLGMMGVDYVDKYDVMNRITDPKTYGMDYRWVMDKSNSLVFSVDNVEDDG